jgi:anthraniloyl-CoA monooxygenase
VKTVCIGGGPAGLYLGVLLKLAQPRHEVTIYERNRPDDTFGFGVVFSDATLGNLADADPVTHAAITSRFARWDDIETHVRGHVFTSTGHGFCGIERKQLLVILQDRARELGVDLRFEQAVTSLDDGDVKDADLVVACDGVASWVREQLAAQFEPDVDVRPNKFVWLGTTVPFTAFTFIFKETAHGLFRVHAYRYSETGSTFIVECTPATWKAAGLEGADEDRTIAVLEDIFAAELRGHRLIKNRSIWRSFPTVRNKRWRAGNVVLVGDAAHTAHFSIGSGTKLAMEDAIALRDAIVAEADVGTALATYEMRRRPEVEALQAAAQASLEWFEGTERYLELPPAQFGYSLMTRSLRVSHASMLRRDPSLARAVERVLAERANLELDADEAAPPPMFTPVELAGLRLANRIALAPWPAGAADGGVVGDGHLVFLGARATGGAGLVLTEPVAASGAGMLPAIGTDEQAVAWRRVVEFVHEKSPAKIGVVISAGAGAAELSEAARRAAFAGFDLLVLDAGAAGDDALDAALTAARAAWPSERPLGVRLRRGADAAQTVAQAGAWRALGARVVVVAPGAARGGGARLDAAPLADRLRNELDLAVILEDAAATPADVDAVIAAGRCDAVALGRALVTDPGFVERAAEAAGWRRGDSALAATDGPA